MKKFRKIIISATFAFCLLISSFYFANDFTIKASAISYQSLGGAYGVIYPTDQGLSNRVSEFTFNADRGTLYFMRQSKGVEGASFSIEFYSDSSHTHLIRSMGREFNSEAGDEPLAINWGFQDLESGTYYGVCYTYVELDGEEIIDLNSISSFTINIHRPNPVFNIVTDGFNCDRTITYTINLKSNVNAPHCVLDFVYNENVVSVIDAGAVSIEKIPGTYEFGQKYNSTNTYTASFLDSGYANFDSETPFIYITFKLKDDIDIMSFNTVFEFYCNLCSGSGSSYDIPEGSNVLIDYYTEKSYSHMINTEPMVIPTCEEGGYYRSYCSCGCTSTVSYVEPLGHDYPNGWVITSEATCTNDGNKFRVCSRCFKEETELIERLGHEPSSEMTVDIEPTCTTPGSQSYHCIRCDVICGNSYSIDTIDHIPGNPVIVRAPTCTDYGLMYKSCIKCGKQDDCYQIEKIPHSYNAWQIKNKPTCINNGEEYRICSVCGNEETKEIPANGIHTYPEVGVVLKEPTATEAGLQIIICSGCNKDSYYVEIPALGIPSAPDSPVLKNVNGQWLYANGDNIITDYTGLVEYYGNYYHVNAGYLDWGYSGLSYYNGDWFYVTNGVLDWNYTGLANFYGTWYHVVNGYLDWNYTGLTNYYGTWYYVENGVLNWDYIGLAEFYGDYYHINCGVLDWSYSGLSYYNGHWFYVTNGVLDWNYTGLTNFYGTWYHVVNGYLDWNYTGLTNYYGTWYYVENGVLNWNSNTLVNYNGDWFYTVGGTIAWNYTGWVEYYGGWYYITNGYLDWSRQ